MKTTNNTYYPQAPAAYQHPYAPVSNPYAPVAPEMPYAPTAAYAGSPAPAWGSPAVPEQPAVSAQSARSGETTERWLGEVVLGVLAALLILGGIVLLCGHFAPVAFAAHFAIAAAYSIAAGVAGIALAVKMPTSARVQQIKCVVALATCEFMLFVSANAISWHYSEFVALALMGIILLVVKVAPVPAALKNNAVALRVNELVVLAMAAHLFFLHGIAVGTADVVTLILAGVFTACAAVLVALRALDLARKDMPRPAAAFPVLFAAAFMGVLLGFVFDVSHLFTSPYAWSALCLACALVCVGAGFWFGEVALRRFGLVVALTCVAKIVLFDISGDVFVHAIALIAGGLACLGISALYALASKRFAS